MKNSLKERTRIQHGVIKEEYRTPQTERKEIGEKDGKRN